MEKVAEGAEASLYRDGDRMTKERHRKEYRHEELDERLRRERTEQEARLLKKARQAGVRVPDVEEEEEFSLSLEEIDGDVLKDVFEEEKDIWRNIGESVARLHAGNIIHGDLTTSNMIPKDGEVYFIDFGLGFFSERVEDRATDLHLLKEVLESTHPAVAEEAMVEILSAYREEYQGSEGVLDRYGEIEGRGRYRS